MRGKPKRTYGKCVSCKLTDWFAFRTYGVMNKRMIAVQWQFWWQCRKDFSTLALGDNAWQPDSSNVPDNVFLNALVNNYMHILCSQDFHLKSFYCSRHTRSTIKPNRKSFDKSNSRFMTLWFFVVSSNLINVLCSIPSGLCRSMYIRR